MTVASVTFVQTGPDPLRFPFWRDADFGHHKGINVADATDALDAMNRESVVAMVAAGPFAEFADDAETLALVPGKIMDPPHTALLVGALAGGVTVECDYAIGTNLLIPNPRLTVGGNFVVDGNVVLTGNRIFAFNENAPVQNGFWVYNADTNTLSRPHDFPTGLLIHQPYYVVVDAGDAFGGNSFKLSAPVQAVVDTDETTWIDAETGAGLQPANTFVAGNYHPNFGPRLATIRPLSPLDSPLYDVTPAITGLSQSIYLNLNNFGYVERYLRASDYWSARVAFNFCLNEHNTIIVPQALYMDAQITASLSGKRIIFLGSGSGGPTVIYMDGTSFMDLTGVHDLRLEGDLALEYTVRAAANTKAIKGTGITRFKADRIFTKGVDFAINVDGTLAGFDIESIGVYDLTTDTPLTIAAASAAGSGALLTRVGRIDGLARHQTITSNVDFTYIANQFSPHILHTGTLTADRTVTLSLKNVGDGTRARFTREGTGTFNLGVGGLINLAIGSWCDVEFDGKLGAWTLTGNGFSNNVSTGSTGIVPVLSGGTSATTASAARDNLGFQSRVPGYIFGCVGDGVTDDTTALVAALNTGYIIDGGNKSYGVSGSIRLDAMANFKGLRNCTLVQLAPATVNCRTLYNSGRSGFVLENVKFDLGGDVLHGDFGNYAGIFFDSCTKFTIRECELYNGGFITAISITNSSDFGVINNYVHDLTYNRPLSDPVDDCIQGYFIYGCSRAVILGNRSRNLTGFLAGVASPRFTRGFSLAGDNDAVCMTNNISSIADQCFDLTGSNGNSGGVFSANIAEDAGTYGFKFANTQREMVIDGLVARRCGLAAFIVSGLSSAVAADHYPRDMIINAGMAIDTGAPNPVTGAAVWPTPANAPTGFKVLQAVAVDLNTPIGVKFSACKAVDRQSVPTMKYGFNNQIPATGIGFNVLVNCDSVGHTTAEQAGFHKFYCKVAATVDITLTTGVVTACAWNSDVDNSTATMHSTSVSNTNIIPPIAGTYSVEGVITFAASAVGSRIVDVWINGATRGFVFKKAAEAAGVTYVPFHAELVCLTTDNIRVVATQDSGGNLNIDHTQSFLSARLLERA